MNLPFVIDNQISATPINNDLYDLANQVRLFTQSRPDYFREAGIGDFNAYFRRARRMVKKEDTSAGVVLFNLLEEIMVRNTRPYIRRWAVPCTSS
jgi:hypothetical protein